MSRRLGRSLSLTYDRTIFRQVGIPPPFYEPGGNDRSRLIVYVTGSKGLSSARVRTYPPSHHCAWLLFSVSDTPTLQQTYVSSTLHRWTAARP